ncbi:TMEM175 family protein [Methylovirgula sp. 4M-Z18]|uniref:TMEM175 family protein n=1 Tax=Methylovirgula sp. 4M-Z18 TaxID=2293567 RepID=UPI000E2F46C5|nr:TMEM175 family protein [Methylovirgula sp. 4M-Z18]RFB80820.1 DUF1211 domain-containing protein [Methylovirgula sp. 4M-Z18]
MALTYNRIAGQGLERLAALSDGIFAVAMTLLILDIKTPDHADIHGEADLIRALRGLLPSFLIFFMSVITLGIFWIGQQTQLNHLKRGDRNLSWVHIAFLAIVSILPFSTRLLAEFTEFQTALIVYWFNILLLGIILYFSWNYAQRHALVSDDTPHELNCAIQRRILIAQGLYFAGMLLCFVSVWASIGFILLVQLNYVLAPRLGFLHKL